MPALDRNRLQRGDMRGEMPEIVDRLLGVQHAEDEMQLLAVGALPVAQDRGDRRTRGFVVAAVEPHLPAGGQTLRIAAVGHALHAGGPGNAGQPLSDRVFADIDIAEAGKGGQRHAGIVDLEIADQAGARQMQRAVGVAKAHACVPARAFGDVTIFVSGAHKEDAERLRAPLEHLIGLGRLRADDRARSPAADSRPACRRRVLAPPRW